MSSLDLRLPPVPTAPGDARRAVGVWLGPVVLGTQPGQDAMVVVGELVTNGVVHTGNDIRLRTSGADGAITIEVTTSPRPAGSPPVAPRTTAPDEEGRGMGIVAALCQDVWVHNGPAGRRVVTCSLKLG